ncbi:MAG: autotransporter domain-containing protein, partial [Novosphingobium sp.]|nr:autotransporter domain-containing protein [Novosphingobium sp.]
GAYAGGRWGAASLRLGAAHTWHRLSIARRVTFLNFTDSLSAHYKAGTTQVFGEAGYTITGKAVTVEPFANLAYVRLHTDAFAESGGKAALTARGQSTDTTFSMLGVHASTDLGANGLKATATLGWRHAFGDVTPTTSLSFAGGGDTFTIAGVPIAKDAAVIDLGLALPVGENASLGFSYNGQFGSGITDNGVRVSFHLRF